MGLGSQARRWALWGSSSTSPFTSKRMVARRVLSYGGPAGVAGPRRTRSRRGACCRRSLGARARSRSHPPCCVEVVEHERDLERVRRAQACRRTPASPSEPVHPRRVRARAALRRSWIAGTRNTASVASADQSSLRGRVGSTWRGSRDEQRLGIVGPRADAPRRSRRRRGPRGRVERSGTASSRARSCPTSRCTPAARPGARSRRAAAARAVHAVDDRLERQARRRRLGSSVRSGSRRGSRPSGTARNASRSSPARRRGSRRARRATSAARSRVADPRRTRRSARSRLWNSPRRRASPSSVPTLPAPADSPKIVTSSGSPPNAAMLSRTHSSAATWSSRPALPEPCELGAEQVGEVQEAERPEPVVDRDDDDVAVLHERVPSYHGVSPAPEHERAAVDPHHHRPPRVVARGRPHVEVEAVLARYAALLAEHRVIAYRPAQTAGRSGSRRAPRPSLSRSRWQPAAAGRRAEPRTGCRGTRVLRRARVPRPSRCAWPRSSCGRG